MNRSSWIRIGLLALVAALVAVPASAMAKPKNKTVEVCKHGCKYRTIQDAVDHTGKNATINVHPGKYKEGVLVSGAKHDGLTIQGTKKNAKKVILEGKNAKAPDGQPANNGIEGDGVDGTAGAQPLGPQLPRQRGLRPRAATSYLMKNLRASFNRAYGLFAFDCTGGPDDQVGRLRPGRLGLLRRRDAGPEQAEVDEARPPRRPRERARLLGHELEVREDHEVELLQQRCRRRPEHARLRALRADRERDHREQQHLLEQLQLLPAELAA